MTTPTTTTNATAASWQAFDRSEPVLQWQLAVPLPASTAPARGPSPGARAALEEVQAALTPIVELAGDVVAGEAEALTSLHDGTPGGVAFRSPVTVRDRRAGAAGHGAVVDVVSGSAGRLLREYQPDLDPAWARRFAADVPFVRVWQTPSPGRLAVTVAFYATIWFAGDDAEVFAKNHARLVAARDALTAVVRRRGGQLLAPLSLQS